MTFRSTVAAAMDQKLPDDQGGGDIIALLEQVAQNHEDREQQHGFGNGAFCQISIYRVPPRCRPACVIGRGCRESFSWHMRTIFP